MDPHLHADGKLSCYVQLDTCIKQLATQIWCYFKEISGKSFRILLLNLQCTVNRKWNPIPADLVHFFLLSISGILCCIRGVFLFMLFLYILLLLTYCLEIPICDLEAFLELQNLQNYIFVIRTFFPTFQSWAHQP